VVLSTSAPPQRILLIDSDPTHRRLISHMLADSGFEVIVATDGRQGLKYFHAQPVDLVVVDRDLPDISGLDLCSRIRSLEDEASVPVLVSGIGDRAESTRKAFDAGAQDYLHKPMSPEEITARVQHALTGMRLRRDLSRQNIELSSELTEGQRELDVAYRQLKVQLLSQRALFDVSHQINSSIDVEDQINILLLTVMGQLAVESAAIFVAKNDGEVLELHSAKGVNPAQMQAGKLEHEDSLVTEIRRYPNGIDLTDLPRELTPGPELKRLMDMGFVLVLPILAGSNLSGLLWLGPKVGGRPFDDSDQMLLSSLLASAGIAMEKAELFKKLQESYVATIQSLMSAMEAKDTYTRGHTARVSRYAVAIAKAMNFSREALEDVRLGSTLHDIGKIGIHEGILNKPSGLTPDELLIMREHPALGDRILRKIAFLKQARKMVRHHHERWDGDGYPDHLRGEEISLGARIVTVADSFDAMTSNRTYNEGMGLEEAVWNLSSKVRTQFCPDTVAVFVRLLRDRALPLPTWMKS
jgi:putative nucleotidyltransferase with HDIG domain